MTFDLILDVNSGLVEVRGRYVLHKEQVNAQKLCWEKPIAGPGTTDSPVKVEATFYTWSEAGIQKKIDKV